MKINRISRQEILELVEYLGTKPWYSVCEVLKERREDKVRQLVVGSDKDEQLRGAIKELDFLVNLSKNLLDQKDMVDSIENNN